jgi:hypothetical protein
VTVTDAVRVTEAVLEDVYVGVLVSDAEAELLGEDVPVPVLDGV